MRRFDDVRGESHIEIVRDYWTRHHNEWHTIREVAEELELPSGSVRSACRTLHRAGELICSQDPAWSQRRVTRGHDHKRSTIALTFRTAAGYMASSRFEALRLPEVIWVGEEPIMGPFCRHCGNPWLMHGPGRECLNYRIHPLLPPGDLPPPST